MKLGQRCAMGCGCNKPRRPNVNDQQGLRAATAPPQTYVWVVGTKTFDILQDARDYSLETGLTISRKLA